MVDKTELILICLVAVALLAIVARKIRVPYPILLTIGGVGLVFGAIISPPDPVAALAVTQNLRVPRRIIVILEGDSLISVATSFISFRFAVAAVMTGAFSLSQASLQFLLVAAGGICVGLA